MRTIFADTSYWIAKVNPRDSHHAAARDFGDEITPLRMVTSELVLVEFLNHLSRAHPSLRAVAARLTQGLMLTDNVDVIGLSPGKLLFGVGLYSERSDKRWSLTDCVSFMIMQERGITEALTSDHHFEQAGFSILL